MFIKSSYCASSSCVEVQVAGTVLVRNSADLNSVELSYTHDEWRDFIAGVKNNEFDV